MQHDSNIEQASDKLIRVKCSPQDLVLTGIMGRKPNEESSGFSERSLFGGSQIRVQQIANHDFTLSDVADSIECRMDVMKGRLPFLKPIDGFVDIGQDITILIKIREIGNCFLYHCIHIILAFDPQPASHQCSHDVMLMMVRM